MLYCSIMNGLVVIITTQKIIECFYFKKNIYVSPWVNNVESWVVNVGVDDNMDARVCRASSKTWIDVLVRLYVPLSVHTSTTPVLFRH